MDNNNLKLEKLKRKNFKTETSEKYSWIILANKKFIALLFLKFGIFCRRAV